MKRYTHIFLDADHTIFDFDKGQAEALESAFAAMHLPFIESYSEHYLKANRQTWDDYESGKIERSTLNNLRFTRFKQAIAIEFDGEQMHQHYLSHLSTKADLFPDALPTIQKLSKVYSLSIVTNGLPEIQHKRFALSGILPYFDTVTIAGEIGLAKPDPAFFNHTLRQLNDPTNSDVLVIGDSLYADIQGGINMGFDTCLFQKHQLDTSINIHPTYHVKSWNELAALLIRS